MIFLNVMNNNKIRKDYGYCSLEDPDIINKDILTIINKVNNTNFTTIDFNNPIIANMWVEYISCDNVYGWAMYPLYMAYNELMWYVSSKVISGELHSNFLTKTEEIIIEPNSRHRVYAWMEKSRYSAANPVTDNSEVGYETVYNYISYKYCTDCAAMMRDYNPRTMIFHAERPDGTLSNYILTAGFNPYKCAGYFSSIDHYKDYHAFDPSLPEFKSFGLYSILRYKLGALSPSITLADDSNVVLTSGRNTKLKYYESCMEYVKRFDFENLGKKFNEICDVYSNIEIDEDYVSIITNAKPGVLQEFIDNEGKTHYYNTFTHVPNVRIDFHYFEDQETLIKARRNAELREKPLKTPTVEQQAAFRAKMEAMIEKKKYHDYNSYFK